VRNEEAAAARLGIKVVPVMFRTPDDRAPAFAMIARERVDALLLHIASPIAEHWPQFIEFSHNRRLPTACAARRFVVLGGLTYYGPNFAVLWYRAAYYVDKILRSYHFVLIYVVTQRVLARPSAGRLARRLRAGKPG
jgi:putative ABC transport system substrate-binding protein